MKGAFYSGNKQFKILTSELKKPGPSEMVVKVAFAGICGTDYHVYLGHMDKRLKLPQVIGHEMSGEIAEVGGNVKGYEIGDKVVVRPLDPCRKCPSCELGHFNCCPRLNFIGIDSPGCFQSYWTIPAHTVHKLPSTIDMKHAALIEPVAVAAHDVRFGEVTSRDYVVVQGAGPIGILEALLCKEKGARVLLSEINTYRSSLAKELGFEVLNPLDTDLVTYVHEQTNSAGADVVFEVTGSAEGASLMTKLARTRGRIVVVAIFAEPVKVDLRQFWWRELRLTGVRNYEHGDFETAISLVVNRSLPLDKLISEVRPLEDIQSAFGEIEHGANFMKVLFQCNDEKGKL